MTHCCFIAQVVCKKVKTFFKHFFHLFFTPTHGEMVAQEKSKNALLNFCRPIMPTSFVQHFITELSLCVS